MSDADRLVLTSADPVVDFGCDLLDDGQRFIESLGDELKSGTVSETAHAQVHRKCELQMTRELDWDSVWLRPWQSVTANGHTVRHNLGVFRPVIPAVPLGASPLMFDVTGTDALSMMQDPIGDTVTSDEAANVVTEMRSVITDAQVPGGVQFDSELNSVTLDRDMVWVLSPDAPATFVRRINDLADAAGARALWVDAEGVFRVQQYRNPIDVKAAWLFDLTDEATQIVHVDRDTKRDDWSRVNWWRFIRKDLSHRPSDGDGQYTKDLSPVGGRKVRDVQVVTAASQDSLVAKGDQIVTTAQHANRHIGIHVTGFPILEHFDVVDYIDPQMGGASLHCQVASWTLDLPSGLVDIDLEVPNG